MKRDELIENVILILCIPALWPVVRAMRGGEPLPDRYELFLALVVVVLVGIAVRRIQRIRAAFREAKRHTRTPF